MTNYEFLVEYSENGVLTFRNVKHFYVYCKGASLMGCRKCEVIEKCREKYDEDSPKVTEEEYNRFKSEYPEYFI